MADVADATTTAGDVAVDGASAVAGDDANTTAGAGDGAGGYITYLFAHLVLKIVYEIMLCVVLLCWSVQCPQDKGVAWKFWSV